MRALRRQVQLAYPGTGTACLVGFPATAFNGYTKPGGMVVTKSSSQAVNRQAVNNRFSTEVRIQSHKLGSRRGQSVIEFSLVAPLLLILMTGMVAFGLTLYNNLVLINGVNIGAQALATSRGQTTDPCATATTAIQNAAPSLTSSKLTYSITIAGGTPYTTTSCTAAASAMVQGANVKVSANYPCTLAVYGMTGTCGLGASTQEMIQ